MARQNNTAAPSSMARQDWPAALKFDNIQYEPPAKLRIQPAARQGSFATPSAMAWQRLHADVTPTQLGAASAARLCRATSHGAAAQHCRTVAPGVVVLCCRATTFGPRGPSHGTGTVETLARQHDPAAPRGLAREGYTAAPSGEAWQAWSWLTPTL
jgi:hypothetical protein